MATVGRNHNQPLKNPNDFDFPARGPGSSAILSRMPIQDQPARGDFESPLEAGGPDLGPALSWGDPRLKGLKVTTETAGASVILGLEQPETSDPYATVVKLTF